MKIFSDKSYLQPGQGHVTMLYPFWGVNPEPHGDPTRGRFDRYSQLGQSFFEMVELTEAAIAVYPRPWEHVYRDDEATLLSLLFAERVMEAGKRVVVFFWSDSEERIPIENAVTFRTSLSRSVREVNEFAMPAWSEDFVDRYCGGDLVLRTKRSKPVVGFCGVSDPLDVSFGTMTKKAGRRLASLIRVREARVEGRGLRARALRTLLKSPLAETNFVIRPQFLGGAQLPDGSVNIEVMSTVRKEYVRNMVESDYIVCARGGGNFSYRLYETLSCGRIPVFIDTDCVLPYHSDIDWKRYCVWVDEQEVDLIAERVAEFHESLAPDGFVELQKQCRRLWEEWLSPVGFFSNFHRHFAATVSA